MDTKPELAIDQPSRLERLDEWLRKRGITRASLASRMGVTPAMVGQLLAGHKRTPARIKELQEFGIPAELLPTPPAPRKRGPKPKHGANRPQEKSGGEG